MDQLPAGFYPTIEAATQAADINSSSQTSKALTYGIQNAKASLLNTAALASAWAGNLAGTTSLLQDAQTAATTAQQYRPDVMSVSDVHGVGDMLALGRNWLVSGAPQLAATVGGTVAGGLAGEALMPAGGVLPGMVGGFLATSPFTVGNAMQATGGNVNASVGLGLADAALQSLVPGLAAERVAGTGAMGFLRNTGLSAAEQGGIGAASGGLGLYEQSLNPSAQPLTGHEAAMSMLDAALGGAVAGAALPAAFSAFNGARSRISGFLGHQGADAFGVQQAAGLQDGLRDLFGDTVQPQLGPTVAAAQADPMSARLQFYQNYLAQKPDAASTPEGLREMEAVWQAQQPPARNESLFARGRQGQLDFGQYDITPQGPLAALPAPQAGTAVDLFGNRATPVPAPAPETGPAEPLSARLSFIQDYMARKPGATPQEAETVFDALPAPVTAPATRTKQQSLDFSPAQQNQTAGLLLSPKVGTIIDLFSHAAEPPRVQTEAETPTAAPITARADFMQRYLASKPDATTEEMDAIWRSMPAPDANLPQPARSRQGQLDLGQHDVTPPGPLAQLPAPAVPKELSYGQADFSTPKTVKATLQDYSGQKLSGAGWKYALKLMEGAPDLDTAMRKLQTWHDSVDGQADVAAARAQAADIISKYGESKAKLQQVSDTMATAAKDMPADAVAKASQESPSVQPDKTSSVFDSSGHAREENPQIDLFAPQEPQAAPVQHTMERFSDEARQAAMEGRAPESEWFTAFKERSGSGLNEAQLSAALDKSLAGVQLEPVEQHAVAWVEKYAAEHPAPLVEDKPQLGLFDALYESNAKARADGAPVFPESQTPRAALEGIMARGDATTRVIAKTLRPLLEGTQLHYVSDPAAYGLPPEFADHLAVYSKGSDATFVNTRNISSQEQLDYAILHESIHAATAGWMDKAAAAAPTSLDGQLYSELNALRDTMAKALPDDPLVREATSSPDEFIAYGLSNKSFQEQMKSVQQPTGGVLRNILSMLGSVLRRAFGLSPATESAFSRFVDLSSSVLERAPTRKPIMPDAVGEALAKTGGDLLWAKQVAASAEKLDEFKTDAGTYAKDLGELTKSVTEYIGSKLKSDNGTAVKVADGFSLGALAERFGRTYPELTSYKKLSDIKNGFLSAAKSRNESMTTTWATLDPRVAKELHTIMLDVSNARVSPLESWDSHTWIDRESPTAADAKEAWESARSKLLNWQKTRPEVYKLYTDARDALRNQRADIRQQNVDNVLRALNFGKEDPFHPERSLSPSEDYAEYVSKLGDAKADDPLYQRAQKQLKVAFDVTREIPGDYFPARRHGNYVLMAEKGTYGEDDYQHAVTHHESEYAALAVERALQGDGWTTARDYKTDQAYRQGAHVPAVLQAMLNSIDEMNVSADEKANMKDATYRAYIMTTGDQSVAGMLSRKNVAGADMDMLNAVSQTLNSGNIQLSKMKYDHALFGIMDSATRKYSGARGEGGQLRRDASGNVIQGDYEWGQLRNSLLRRIMATGADTSPMYAKMAQTAGIYYMGLNPAHVVTVLTQPWVAGLPYLGARHGFVASASAMGAASMKAAKFMAALVGDISANREGVFNRIKALSDPQSVFSPDNLAFFERNGFTRDDLQLLSGLQAKGALDFTNASSILRYDQGPTGKLGTVAKAAGLLSHYGEIMNRLVVAFSTRELMLAKDPRASIDDIVDEALTANQKVNGNFAASNKAPMFGAGGMAGKLTPLVFQFSNYSRHMLETMYLNTWKAFSADQDPVVRAVARRELTYTMLTTAGFAGVLGMPLATSVAAVMNTMVNSYNFLTGHGDDQPYDVRAEMRNHLYDLFGATGERMLSKGLFTVLGADISSKVGLGDLIPFSEQLASTQRLEDTLKDALPGAFGLMGQLAVNTLSGVRHAANGDVIGAVREAGPAFIKNAAAAVQAGQTGYFVSNDGTPIPVKATVGDVMWTALGFTPTDLAAYNDGKVLSRDLSAAMAAKKSFLLDMFSRATISGDSTLQQNAVTQMKQFNMANPTFQITGDSVRGALTNFNRLAAGGLPVPLNTRQRALLAEVQFAKQGD